MLWSLLTMDRYSDGTRRVLPTIKIERLSGGYEIVLQEHSSRKQCTVRVNRLDAIPKALERLISRDMDCWRPYDSHKVKAKDLGEEEENA